MRTPLLHVVIAGALLAALGVGTSVAAPPSKTPPRFVDNGDGTVTDNQTGLMWEKKTDANVNDTYSWTITNGAADGTMFTDFLPRMQCVIASGFTCGLAGHYDWRIPNIVELQTIVDCSQPNCLDPIFGPTTISGYWSATTQDIFPDRAYYVYFFNGRPDWNYKTFALYVRAVRGGK
jgi:hypothetical protein